MKTFITTSFFIVFSATASNAAFQTNGLKKDTTAGRSAKQLQVDHNKFKTNNLKQKPDTSFKETLLKLLLRFE